MKPTVPLLLLVGFILTGSQAQADPALNPGSFADYIKQATSTVGELTFSNFKYSSSDSNVQNPDPALDPTKVMVMPNGEGLEFVFNVFTASRDMTAKSATFSYDVMAASGFTGASLMLTGSAVDPGAKTEATKMIGPPGLTLDVFEGTTIDVTPVTTSQKSASTQIAGRPTTLHIDETVMVSTMPTGNIRRASVDNVVNHFTTVPESSPWALILVGSALVLMARRYRNAVPRRAAPQP